MSSLTSYFGGTAVLPYFVGVATPVLAWLGVRYSQRAPLQQTLNDAFQKLVTELQNQHAQDSALISALRAENHQLKGELRQAKQVLQSYTAVHPEA